jgi:hypothetical protein
LCYSKVRDGRGVTPGGVEWNFRVSYLNIINDPNQRRLFSKFRISNHKLEIEFGRYSDVPRQERLCKYCDKLAVEDEFHFSFECEKNENLHNILKDYFQMSSTDESKRKLLSDLMSLNDPVITDLFSEHISKCFYIRDMQQPLNQKSQVVSFYILYNFPFPFFILYSF